MEQRYFSLRPYLQLMRLHQRTGIWLLLWPCWWSIALGSIDIIHDLGLILLFLFGAIVMRGAGCVINDIWDRRIDVQVQRTRDRPLAAGTVKLSQAIALFILLLSIGLGILLTLNLYTVKLGIIFAVMIIIYPLMKRVLWIPQLFLGLTFNAGALMGWSAVSGELPLAAWLCYSACFFWTLGYDTIYAHQDKKDDTTIGIKSAAITFGRHSRKHITCYYLLMIALLALAGLSNAMIWPYYLGLMIALIFLLRQIQCVDLKDQADCMQKFRSNVFLGWPIFIGIIADTFIR